MRGMRPIEGLIRPVGMLVCVMLLTVKAIREKIGELMDRVQAIVDVANKAGRDLSEDERTEIDGIMGRGKKGEADFKPGKIHALEQDLSRAELIEARQAEIAAGRRGNAPPGGNPLTRSDGPGDQTDTDPQNRLQRVRIPATAMRVGKLRTFHGQDGERRAYLAGQWFAATLFKHEAAQRWCGNLGLDTRFHGALAGSADPSGGFLVPGEIEQAIIDLRETYGIFRQYARVVPMGRDTKDQPVRASGLTAHWVGENDEITASDKSWGNVKLVAKKLGALCRYSTEIDEDAIISIGDDLAGEIAYAFAVAEDAAGFNGDGSSTYGGVVGLANALNAGSIIDALSGNVGFTTLDMDDFEKTMGALPDYPGIQPAWFISKPGWANSMARLQDAAGGNRNQEIADGPIRMSFLGYPVVWTASMTKALTSTTSTILAYFGDLRLAAVMGNRRGLTIRLSDQRYFEFDQIAIKGTQRIDLNIHSRGDASNPGAVVALKAAAQ
jgi:HK97 family phage major capsid protein